jgi:DNA-binding transcriptional MerR regulator
MIGDSGSGGLGRRSYEVQEVLRLLGVKAHVLRYWEQSLPLIRSRRNEAGHRVWSAAQVRMLLRIRHLVLRRGMSVAAAGNAILYEAEPGPADTKARLESLRAGLITLLLRSRAELARASRSAPERERPAAVGGAPAAGAGNSEDGERGSPDSGGRGRSRVTEWLPFGGWDAARGIAPARGPADHPGPLRFAPARSTAIRPRPHRESGTREVGSGRRRRRFLPVGGTPRPRDSDPPHRSRSARSGTGVRQRWSSPRRSVGAERRDRTAVAPSRAGR